MGEVQEYPKTYNRRWFLTRTVGAALGLATTMFAGCLPQPLEGTVVRPEPSLPPKPKLPQPETTPTPVIPDIDKIKRSPNVPSPTPTPEAFFSLGKVDFILDTNIKQEDGQKLITLFKQAYPEYQKFFGFKPATLPGNNRLKVLISAGQYEIRINEALTERGRLLELDQNNQRTMYLFDPGDHSTALHELSHVFINDNISIKTVDFITEGIAVAATAAIIDKLKILPEETFLLRYLGEPYDGEPFTNQDLAGLSYSESPALVELRYFAAGLFWLDVCQQDPTFFQKFYKLSQQKFTDKSFPLAEVYTAIKQCFTGDLAALEKKHPIAKYPKLGRKITFTPLSSGKVLAVCYHDFQSDGSDKPLGDINLNVTVKVINEKGETVMEKTGVFTTDKNGILGLFDTPPHPDYQGKRIPPTKKPYQLVFTVTDLKEGIQRQIQIAFPKITVIEEQVK